MRCQRFFITILFCVVLVSCVGCKRGFLSNGTYYGVDDSSYYITVKDETITLNNPYFGDDTNEDYHLIVYIHRVQEKEAQGIILTDEEKAELKKDLPDFNPNDYLGKSYRLEFMNKETYVKGENYDIMLWDNDTPVEILSGEYNPKTGILNIGGTDYICKK